MSLSIHLNGSRTTGEMIFFFFFFLGNFYGPVSFRFVVSENHLVCHNFETKDLAGEKKGEADVIEEGIMEDPTVLVCVGARVVRRELTDSLTSELSLFTTFGRAVLIEDK